MDSSVEIKNEPLPSSDDEDGDTKSVKGGMEKSKGLHENGFTPEKVKKVAPSVEDVHNHDDFVSSQFVERYKCHHCEKSYKNLRSLNQHFREVQVCRVCKKSLPSIEEFTSHILEDHTVGALCGVCMNSFRSRARLVEHVRTHTQLTLKKPDVNRVRKSAAGSVDAAKTCKKCGQELSPLSPHTCHANVCKLCRKPLRTRSEFEVHMMRLHCSENSCQFCGVRLPSLPSVISHLKSHTSLRYPAHKCTKCGQRFSNAARLAGHECRQVVTHSSPKKSKSPEYTNSYSPDKSGQAGGNGAAWLPLEDMAKQAVEHLKYECQWCEEKFKYLRDLKRHRLELHSCKFCKKILKTQAEFENHLMEEHSSKDECQFCLRKFVCTNALRTHLKIHTSITHKVHQCKKCKQKFASVKDKLKHDCLKIRCFFCDEAFASSSDMESHASKNHPDSKILKCHSCSKSFPSKETLKKHIKLKHNK